MPSDFPRTPKFLKGALVAYESQFLGPIPNVIVFQYNPETLSRSLSQRTASASQEGTPTGVARRDAQRVPGPPEETITLTVNLDAADQLSEPSSHPHTVVFGLHPTLAALELLLYPKTEQVLISQALSRAGTTQTNPPDLPIVLFVWGISRVVPVRLTSFAVREKAFDQALNPILAEVDLGMKVLTYMDLDSGTLGYNAYMVYQTQKEVLARLNLINSVEQVVGMLPFWEISSMFFKGSRYEKVETDQIVDSNGRVVSYKKVRFTPETKALFTHLHSEGERLDHLAFRYYKDSERFWRICDANQTLWPDDLLADPGSRILIPPSS